MPALAASPSHLSFLELPGGLGPMRAWSPGAERDVASGEWPPGGGSPVR
jgi:hypothetical protein